jgi:precorrin-6B methylase 1
VATGALTVVGTGIQLGAHLTPEARATIEKADIVLSVVSEPVMQGFLERLNDRTRSMHELYTVGESRAEAYEAMTEAILAEVRAGNDVCAVFYGHPGVFVAPSHESVRRARAEGFPARMLPGISAEDCLFADLGVDPSRSGCQSYEATDFLVAARAVEPAALLILWQVGVVNERSHVLETDPERLAELRDRLLELYPEDHEAIVYEASPYPVGDAIVVRTSLARLCDAGVTPASTLVVPPRPSSRDPVARR